MMDRILIQRYSSPCGELLLGSFGDRLCLCNWVGEKHPGRVERRLRSVLDSDYEAAVSDISSEAARQLTEYFERRRTAFDIPLLFVGTDFQKSVWNLLLEIPYGSIIPYGEMAVLLGMPGAVRAVANAVGANAISIFAPCHRVIGGRGALSGYGGGLEAKRYLLELESAGRFQQLFPVEK